MLGAENSGTCKTCNGAGYVQIDDLNVTPCICEQLRMTRQHLGPEIAAAPWILATPLYVDGPSKSEPQFDGTQHNLILRGYWAHLLSHFKRVLVIKGRSFYFEVMTDEKIRTVYVGADSYMARSRSVRDEVETYNSLGDLVESQQLLIIRLGFLAHKNVAAAGALKEALLHREVVRKPTWLVEDPYYEWKHSYSDDVGAYVNERYKEIDLKRDDAPPSPIVQESPGMAVDEDEVSPEPQESVAPTTFGDDPILSGGGKKKHKPFKKRTGGGF